MESTGAAPSVAVRAFAPPTVKRSDSGVALGLFSKIAAARKEKLSPFAASATYTSSAAEADAPKERRASTSTPHVGTSQFPGIHDATARSAHPRTAVKRDGTSRGLGHTHRLSKLEDPQRGRASPPVCITPVFPIARGSHARTAAPERVRRSLYEAGKGAGLAIERILPLEELGPRPLTAGDEPVYGHARGYVRRATDVGINHSALPSQSRTSEWMQPPKPSIADSVTGRISSTVVLRAQPDVLVLESPPKTSADPVLSHAPEQEIYFADAADVPGVPVVYRHQKAKASNPERLNLDRRNLPVLPLLEGEQMLRLLNLQNNVIRKIDNLTGLPNLIFLDLYNNRIERLENLHAVPNLRVLMLGKNRLQRIENLEALKKLDVLDLHSNELERMENLNELTELRVLNLGGNRIKCLEGIDKLHLLTELNLRRNSITSISATIGRMPSLQRLFLSNNKLDSLELLEPLFAIPSVIELRLDNNAVSELNEVEYRSRMIQCFPLLKHLDLRPLSDAERKEGLLFYSQARAASKQREDLEVAQRGQAIAHIRSLWDKRERIPQSQRAKGGVPIGQLARRNSGSGKGGDNPLGLPAVNTWGRPRIPASTGGGGLTSPESVNVPEEGGDTKPTSREECTVHKNNIGYSEIKVHGEYRVLAIYGDALAVLDSAKVHASVNAIQFHYVSIDRIKAVAASSTSANLKLFARLRRLHFAHNDIESFHQLAWLAAMGSRSEELLVTHNAVCSRTLFRQFVASRISNVARLNGKEVTDAERTVGRQLFQKPGPRQRSTESSTSGCDLSSMARTKDGRLQSAHRSPVASFVVNDILVSATAIEKKDALVDDSWRALLIVIAKETFEEIAQHGGNYMSGCLDGL